MVGDGPMVAMERCTLSNSDIFNDPDGTLTRFQGHGIFEAEYLKKTVRLRDKVTIEH